VTKPWIRKLLLAVAILVMPLQGIAVAATFVQCHEQAAVHATHGHQHDDGAVHDHGSGDDSSPGTQASHHLCGHFVLHAPGSFSIGTEQQFSAWSPTAAPSYILFFPEHPRRPPRA